MSVTEGGANVVQSGLVFYYDSANRNSYVSGSTTANNLKDNTTLTFKKKLYYGGTGDIVTVIAPTYSTSNAGITYFNGLAINSGEGLYLPSGDTSTNLSTYVSLSVWFKKTSYNYSYVECPAAKGFNTPAGGGQPYCFYLLNNSVYARITTNTVAGYGDTGTPYSLNVWNNAVLTYDGSYLKLYLNGVLKSSIVKTGPIMNVASPFNIGCQNNGGYYPSSASVKTNEYFKGYVPNVSIYNKALTASEVLQNYNALKPRFNN